MRLAVQLLHDLGTIQYFDNDFLRDYVVINPQWIVNVMACVVSAQDSSIQVNIINSFLFHREMNEPILEDLNSPSKNWICPW